MFLSFFTSSTGKREKKCLEKLVEGEETKREKGWLVLQREGVLVGFYSRCGGEERNGMTGFLGVQGEQTGFAFGVYSFLKFDV